MGFILYIQYTYIYIIYNIFAGILGRWSNNAGPFRWLVIQSMMTNQLAGCCMWFSISSCFCLWCARCRFSLLSLSSSSSLFCRLRFWLCCRCLGWCRVFFFLIVVVFQLRLLALQHFPKTGHPGSQAGPVLRKHAELQEGGEPPLETASWRQSNHKHSAVLEEGGGWGGGFHQAVPFVKVNSGRDYNCWLRMADFEFEKFLFVMTTCGK